MNEKMTADEALMLLKWAEKDRDKLRAEVERLREDLLQAERDALAESEALVAEVERLRVANEGKAELIEALQAAWDEQEAEVERLRKLLYRACAPTASLLEAEDREAAIREGYELTRPKEDRDAT